MSATLGDVSFFVEDLKRRTGRDTAVVDDAERPVPLSFRWSMEPLDDTLEELVSTGQDPVYVVHFTQAAAVEHASNLLKSRLVSAGGGLKVDKEAIAERIGAFRFGAGFGKTLSRLVRNGIGVHHAGMLPKYRRLVETLAQAGLLRVICGTDTLGVGINVPIRTVLFTGLAKFDGTKQRVLRTREFLQIAGRAGRAGYDTAGYVVVQAPEHVIENELAKAKIAARQAAGKKKSKAQLKKPPEGTVVWTEQTFDKLVAGVPERLTSRMKVDNAMLVNVVSREEDAFAVMRRLVTDNHEDRRGQLRLARRALRLTRSLVRTGIVTRLEEVDGFGRRYVLAVDLPDDFALNQPLAHFALAAFDVLDPEAETYALDVVSIVEAVLEAPRQILMAQQHAARGEAIGEMKADGDRVRRADGAARGDHLAAAAARAPRGASTRPTGRRHPWLPEDALGPKSVVREMWEQGMGFTDFVGRYQLARSEGLVLRYLTDAYRTLRQTVPEAHRAPEVEDVIEWLGETVRQTDSSLLDEWEALSDPDHASSAVAHHEPPPPPRPLSQAGAPLRGDAAQRDVGARRRRRRATTSTGSYASSARPPTGRTRRGRWSMGRSVWDAALEDYYAEHDRVLTDGDARGPDLLVVGEERTGEPVGAEEGTTARAARRTPDDPRPRGPPRLGHRGGGGLRRHRQRR